MNREFDTESALAPLRRHWRAVFVVGVTATALLVVVLVMWPNRYESESKLFLRIGRESVALDPSAMVGPTMPISRTRASEITSAMAILDSQRTAQLVVEHIGEQRIINQPVSLPQQILDGLKKMIPRRGAAATATAAQQQMAASNSAIRWVEKATTVECPKESTVISVSCKASTPELAHDVVAAMTSVFRDEYLRVHQTEGVESFFQNAIDERAKDLHGIRSRLGNALTEMGSVTVDGKKKLLLAQQTEIELAIQANVRTTQELEATIAILQTRIGTLSETIVESTEELESGTRARLEEQFYEFLKRENERVAQLTPEHPLAAGLAREHKALEEIVKLLPANSVTTRRVANPMRQGLLQQLETAQVSLAGARAAHATLLDQQQHLQGEMSQLNTREPAVLALQQELEAANGDYQARREQLQLARVQAAMDRARISNVNVAQPATFDLEPASPNRKLALAVGLLFIVMMSLSVPYALDYFRPRPTSVPLAAVNEVLGVPLLGTVPRAAPTEPIAS